MFVFAGPPPPRPSEADVSSRTKAASAADARDPLTFLRDLERRNLGQEGPDPVISLSGGSPQFHAYVVDGQARCGVGGSWRDALVVQLIRLLDSAGIQNLHKCSIDECQHIFVKTYRREFCCDRCQQRAYKRQLRQRQREEKEQQTRPRRRQITKRRR